MKRLGLAMAFGCLCAAAVAAQDQERVTLTGCLYLGDSLIGRPASAPKEAFVLTNATREAPMPAAIDRGTPTGVAAGGSIAGQSSSFPVAVGTSGSIGSAGAGTVYAVDGDIKDLAKRVGRRVEIIGRIGPKTTTEFERVNVTGLRSLGSCQ